MKLRKRGKPRLSSYLFVIACTSCGLTLSDFMVTAEAQSTKDQDRLQSLILAVNQAVPTPSSPSQQGNGPTISDIVVLGNKTLSKEFIVALSGVKIGDKFTDQLQSEMVTKLYTSGYFGFNSGSPETEAVKVHSEEPSPPNGTCKVVIEVEENATIQNIQLTGTGPIKPEDVKPLLHFKTGSVYSDVQFHRDVNDIINLYSKKGYIVTPGQDVFVDDKGVFHVQLVVTRVSEIRITGLHKSRRYVITREMRTKTGDYLNTNTLLQDRSRLLNLDLFEDVGLSNFTTGPGLEGITINLVEKRTGTVTAGVGYSDRESLIGFAEVTETDFRGTGEAINLRGEIGGVANKSSVEVGFNEPYLDRHHTALNVQLYDKTVYRFDTSIAYSTPEGTIGSNRRYDEQHLGTTLTVSQPIKQYYRAALTFRAESVTTDALALPVADSLIVQDGPLFTLGGAIIHDTRDLDLDPASGGYQQINIEGGAAHLKPPSGVNVPLKAGVFGNVSFIKPLIEARQYISLTGRRPLNNPSKDETVLALRGMAGTTIGTLPFFEQFFVGGSDNLRGYRDDRFWGNNLFLASAELRQPIAPKFKGVLFTDIGDAWGGPYAPVILNGLKQNSFHPYFGVGLGIRVVTPLGPLRLDYGIGQEGGRAHFSIGNTF